MPEWNDDILQPSPEDILSGVAIRPDMLKDLFAVSKIAPDKAAAIAAQLKLLTGLNDEKSIQHAIKQILGDAEKVQTKAVCRALVNLDSGDIPTLLKTLEKWANRNDARKEVFTDELISNLREVLGVIIADDFPAIELMQKANALVRDTSGELLDAKYVCDLRPVFNLARTNIDAFVLVANLRLLYSQQSGQRLVCEIALTEEELVTLKEKTDKALAKMKILKEVGATLNPAADGGAG